MREFETADWPKVLFGVGKSLECGKRFKIWNTKSVLAVYGKGIAEGGQVEPILDSIRAEGITVHSFCEVEPEVPDYVIEKIAHAALACNADGLLAIGGGSTIDAVKYASVYMYSDRKPMADYLDTKPIFSSPEQGKIKMIFIPTTAGTGAEMTDRGPVMNTKIHKKSLYIYFPPAPADLAILDPRLTLTLPPYLTASTAMDALAHAIESMTSKARNARAELFCGQAIEMICRSLPRVMDNPQDLESRSELLLAANWAIAVESKRHIGHALTEGLGSVYPINHGHCCALALPETMRFLNDVTEIQPEMQLIAQKMNLPCKKDLGFSIAEEIDAMNARFGLAASLKELGFSYKEEEIIRCTDIIAMDLPHLSMSVKNISYNQIYDMVLRIYG